MARKTVKAPGVFSKLKRKLTGGGDKGNAKKKGLPKSKKATRSQKVGAATANKLMGKKAPVSRKTVKARKRGK